MAFTQGVRGECLYYVVRFSELKRYAKLLACYADMASGPAFCKAIILMQRSKISMPLLSQLYLLNESLITKYWLKFDKYPNKKKKSKIDK